MIHQQLKTTKQKVLKENFTVERNEHFKLKNKIDKEFKQKAKLLIICLLKKKKIIAQESTVDLIHI